MAAADAVAAPEDATAVLQLLGVANNLGAKLAACEAMLRAALSDLESLVGSVDASKEALDPVTLRLLSSEVSMTPWVAAMVTQ